MQTLYLDISGLFILMVGFVLGLGAVTVIDIHGFLGRKSYYWTEATTRTHKITKPLIWLGITLAILGGFIFYRNFYIDNIIIIHLISIPIMVFNGMFLSFKVSPFLIQREKEGNSSSLLPDSWQRKITISFIISFILWWGNLLLLGISISKNLFI